MGNPERDSDFLPTSDFDLAKDEPSFSSRVKIDFGAISHVGKVRKNNEDAYIISQTGRFWRKMWTNIDDSLLRDSYEEDAYVMAVADGIGGLSSGEVASRMVITTVVNLVLSSVKWGLKLDHPEFREQEIREGINRAVEYLSKADLEISRAARRGGAYRRMGTTFTGSYSFADDLFIFHVGDSRAYLFRKGKLSQLTHDHTVAQSLADAGVVPQEEVPTLHLRRVLTRAIGTHEGEVDVEIHHLKLENDDIVLICSDGLSDAVKSKEIERTLNSKSTSQEMCDTLLNLAMDAGGVDNVTVVIGRYKF